MKKINELKKVVEESKKTYYNALKNYTNARDAEALPVAVKKYQGKFFKVKSSNKTYLFIIRLTDIASAECVEFSISKDSGYSEGVEFRYFKKYYFSGMLSKEVSRNDAKQIVSYFLEQIKNYLPVDFIDS